MRSWLGGMFLPVCLIFGVQAAVSRAITLSENPHHTPNLGAFPGAFGQWQAQGEEVLDKETVETLEPTEYLLRVYRNGRTGDSINLFIGYFASLQRTYGPHSPRVCLPGVGWLVRSSKVTTIPIGGGQAIPVNEYEMEKANERILVMYWYQNDRDVWADEFWAKLLLLPDLIRYRRSDVSLVRLITPVTGPSVRDEYARSAAFAAMIFPPLKARLR